MEHHTPHPSEHLEFISLDHVEYSRPDWMSRGTSSTGETKAPDLVSKHFHDDAPRPTSACSSGSPQPAAAPLMASQSEHRMTLQEALRIYPKAIGWAVGISFAIIMEGYDTALVTSFYAFDEFQKQYGV